MTHQLTLYFREGCHLCEDMLLMLENRRDELDIQIHPVDVDADQVLQSRYGNDVPVLCLAEQEICRHFLDMQTLETVLHG